MPRIGRALCAYPTCNRECHIRELCANHHLQQAAGRELSDISPTKPCADRKCERPASSRGYCGRHYQALRNAGLLPPLRSRATAPPSGTCQHPGCLRPFEAKGYCHLHYERMKRGASLDAPSPITEHPDWCAVPGCVRAYSCRGLCATHYQAWLRAGRPRQADWIASQ